MEWLTISGVISSIFVFLAWLFTGAVKPLPLFVWGWIKRGWKYPDSQPEVRQIVQQSDLWYIPQPAFQPLQPVTFVPIGTSDNVDRIMQDLKLALDNWNPNPKPQSKFRSLDEDWLELK